MRIEPNAVQPGAAPGPGRARARAEAAPSRAEPGGGDAPVAGNPLPQEAAEARPRAAGEGGTEEAVRRIQSYVQKVRRELRFSVDEATGRTVIKVLDPETEEVIRQIPPEEIIAIARALSESPEQVVDGLLFRARA